MNRIILCIIFATIALSLNAANQYSEMIIIGQITSADDHKPIEAANISIKGTILGTTSNPEGLFMLRLPAEEATICVSVIGYRTKEIKLKNNGDQIINIQLKEESTMLQELIIFPGDNPAIPFIRQVIDNKKQNNYELTPLNGRSIFNKNTTKLFLNNISISAKKRKKLLSQIKNSTLSQHDSLLILPLYYKHTESTQHDSVKEITSSNEKQIDLIPREQLGEIVTNYTPKINFYNNTIILGETSFISPLSNQSTLYYDYFLTDSTITNSDTLYTIHFRPKKEKIAAFKGKMSINKQTFGLAQIEAEISKNANINYISGCIIKQLLEKQSNQIYYPKHANFTIGYNINLSKTNTKTNNHLIFNQNETWDSTSSSDTIPYSTLRIQSQKAPFADIPYISKIDSLNQTKIQKFAFIVTDVILNGYFHAGPIDIGPAVNLLRFNRLEGIRPTLTLRTSEKLMKNFTIGGYGGYGFTDKRWKFGGEMQFAFGKNKQHNLAALYSNDVYRYGYENSIYYSENMVGSNENLLSMLSGVQRYSNLAQYNNATLKYKFEKNGLRLTGELLVTRTYSNENVPFMANGTPVPYIMNYAARAAARFSFNEYTLNNFFHTYYLRTSKPIINIIAEYGQYQLPNKTGDYGKFMLFMKQNLPIFGGKFRYLIETGAIIGDVPFPLLSVARGSRGGWFDEYGFNLMNQMEFISDLYLMGHMRYMTSGWIFNNIPWVNKLNLREELILKIGYGSLRDGHQAVLNLPAKVNTLNTPYIEAGVGIANILRLFSLESIWRLTHRNDPGAITWGVRFRYDLDF